MVEALKARNKLRPDRFISPLQGSRIKLVIVSQDSRATRFALGYYISRLQREDRVD
jgi:hypothetical protein